MINKLGLVLECDAGGPDELVFTCLVRRLSPGTAIKCATRGSKPGIFNGGVDAAKGLIEVDGCDLALVVWDLKPFWQAVAAKNCVDESEELKKQLVAFDPGVREKIRLLCLTYELETWMLAEDRAIRDYLSTEAHKSKFKVPGGALAKTDAKAFMISEFKKARGIRYQDYSEAIRLVQRWSDTSRVGHLDSFRRFSELLTGNAEAAFNQGGEACADLVYQAAMIGKR